VDQTTQEESMAADEDDFGRKVHVEIPSVSDRTIHVSSVTAPDGMRLVDIREHVTSLDAYGRGITLPMSLLGNVMDGLEDIWEANGAGEKGTPTEVPRG
jgi:hypothetical protein